MTSGGNRGARSTTTSLEQPDWASIVAVTLSISAFGVALGLTYPLISLVLAARGFGESVVGFNAGVYALGMVTATLLMPRMTNRLSAGRLIVSGLAGSAAIIMGFGLLPWVTAWFALRFALGFAINTVFILAEAWLNAACPDHLRGRVTAVFTASMSAGFATGPLGVPVFGKEDGFGFAACAVLVALVTISFALLSRRARVQPEAAPPGSLTAFARAAPTLILMIFVFSFVDAAAIALLPVYFLDRGLSEGWSATTVTALFFGVLGTMPLIGFGLDRWHRSGVAIVCAIVAAIAAAGLPVVDARGLIVWPLLFFLGGAFSGIYTCALTGLGERFRGGMLVAGSATFALIYAVGAILGPTSIGALMELAGPEAIPASFVVVLLTIAGLLSWTARRPSDRRAGSG
jgi:MFS family permease